MKEQLLNRFLKYVQIRTPSTEETGTNPSSACQFDLAHALEEEMKALGISQVHVDEHCYVYGNIPATPGLEDAAKIAFIAHIDTVPCARQVVPLVHENYDGGDIELPAGGRTIKVKDYPRLSGLKGRTIITSDGTTILGADDKAGVAEIMTLAEEILTKNIPHGKICFGFTPDEEIGSGADLLDLDRLGADFAFTVDGGPEGGVEYETFNAADAKIEFHGVNIHPGSAKGIMINAAAVACEFQSFIPENETPETTEGYEGFYHLIGMKGATESASLRYIIRDHDMDKFKARKQFLEEITEKLNAKYGEGTVEIELKDSYYNMMEVLKNHMHLVDAAKTAIEKAGLTPSSKPIRGGTDGSHLSFRGLPCPDLGTGGFACHGPFEHVSLEGMEKVTEILLNIVEFYTKQK